MSFNSKRTIVSMLAGLALFAAYAAYALGAKSPAPGDLKAWAAAMLIFIGISVGVMVVIQILFHIAYAIGTAVRQRSEKDVERIMKATMAEDERDKLIGLKTSRIGYACAGLSFVAALGALAAGLSAVAALHILLGAVAAGSIVEGIAGIRYYEKGVRNG